MRTISTAGKHRVTSSDRLDHRLEGVTEDERPPRAEIVDVLVAVDVHHAGAVAPCHEDGAAADGVERPDRGVDSAGHQASRALQQLLGSIAASSRHGRRAASRAK